MWEGETQFTLRGWAQDIYKAHQASRQESSAEKMLFPDGLFQPDLFITERLPCRLHNSVAARVNSVARRLLPAACLAQGESDVGQMEGTVLLAPSSEEQSRYQKVMQPF